MKKTISIFAAFLLALTIVFLSIGSTKAKAFSPDPGLDKRGNVQALLNSYIDGNKQYTKLTTLETSNISEKSGQYHADANGAKRRTYYDEDADVGGALLMCNYDGTFGGEGGINSGYRTVDSEKRMYHCSYSGDANGDTISNLTSDLTDGWYVSGTSVVEYYDVLSDLASAVKNNTLDSMWAECNGVYTYTTEQEYLTTANQYNDGVLKKFQWFAAPMLVVKDSLQIKKVQISEGKYYIAGDESHINDVLIIKILSADNSLISTCYVVPGLQTGEIKVADCTKIYFDLTNCEWNTNNAWFAVYFFNDSTQAKYWTGTLWFDNNKCYCDIPNGNWESFIFVRMASGTSLSVDDKTNWDHKWDQTDNLSFSSGRGRTFQITGWNQTDHTDSLIGY